MSEPLFLKADSPIEIIPPRLSDEDVERIAEAVVRRLTPVGSVSGPDATVTMWRPDELDRTADAGTD